MIRETIREMTPEEREELERSMAVQAPRLVETVRAIDFWSVFSWVIAIIILWLRGCLDFHRHPALSVLILACLLAWAVREPGVRHVIDDHRMRSKNYEHYQTVIYPKILDAIEDGRACVTEVEAVAVIEVEGGEGYHCVFDIGGGELLFLPEDVCDELRITDDYFDQFVGNKPPAPEEWPSDRFTLIRTIVHHLSLGVSYTGNYLEPLKTIEYDQLREDFELPLTETVIESSLEDFVRSLMKE